MESPQQQQTSQSFNDDRAAITAELHAIVDNLQPADTPPQVAPTHRPWWQRTIVWQVPLCLIALAIILMYNPRVDNCNGFKITYKRQVLCISNDADFFLFVENFVCDFIESDKSIVDSLVADETASDKMKAYFDKHNFSIETQPIEAEVLRGMRGQYDSASFCKNFTKACWNAGIRLLNAGKTDSACLYFNKIEAWSWRDSVLTAADKAVITRTCYADFAQNMPTEQPLIDPNADFVEGECCMINYDNLGFRSKPLDAENMRAVNNRTQIRKETPQSIEIDKRTLIGTLRRGEKAFFLGKTGSFFKIRLEKNNQIGYIATLYGGISTLIKGCNSNISTPKVLVKDSVLGFDLYHRDALTTPQEWQEAAQTYKFVYMKASEGTTGTDSRIKEFAEKATKAGLLKGAYHYFRLLNMDVDGQVNNFLRVIESSKQTFEMPFMVDIEVPANDYNEPTKSKTNALKDTISKNIKQFLTAIERRTYKRPIIYTTRRVWEEFLQSPEGFEKYPLWIADYDGLAEPNLPKPWKNYAFWQFSDNGKVGSTNGYTVNIFNGNYIDFQRFIRESRIGQSKN